MMDDNTKLDLEWYQNENVAGLAVELLGKYLCTNIDGRITKGMIVETEAYCGRNDAACHANNNRRTSRNEIMHASGGHAYVYLCYGIHHLFNVVTNREGHADAILIRALEPVDGITIMLQRRQTSTIEKRLTSGPGVLTKALGIDLRHYGLRLDSDEIWIEKGRKIQEKEIAATTRIGVEYAGEDALKLWRFYVKENPWVSKIPRIKA